MARRAALADWTLGPRELPQRWYFVVITWAALTLLGAAISFLRLPPDARNVLWAEDGHIFLTRALQPGAITSVFEAWAGYLHIVPRLATIVAVQVAPLDLVPLAMTVMACLLTGTVAAGAFVLLRPRVPSIVLRGVVFVSFVALPIAGVEVNGSVANSHWYLMAGLFIAIATRQASPVTLLLATAMTLAATTSDPLALIFIPLVALRLATMRQRRDLLVPIAWITGLVIQFAVVAHSQVESSGGGTPTIVQLARATAFRVFLVAIAGKSGAAFLWEHTGIVSLIAAVLVVTVAVAFAVRRGGQLGGLSAAGMVVAVVLYALEAWIRWFPVYDPASGIDWGGSRYSVPPNLLVIIAMAAAAGAVPLSATRLRRLAVYGLAALMLVVAIPSFTDTSRHLAQAWTDAVTQADASCELPNPDLTVSIPTAPEGWSAEIPCAVLERWAAQPAE